MTDTSTQPSGEGLWARLRRRKVVQWGVVYVAAAWGFLQGLEYLSGTYDWPRQIQQLTTLALLIGLPVVLVLAWYHGDRGQQRISTPELAILTLLLLLGGGAFWYYDRASERAAGATGAVTQPAAPAAASPEAAPAPDQKSIAVLPFVDMSAAKDQEYMSNGVAEELLNLLAKVPDLKVIARTSSFAFKGKDTNVEDIARELNVAHMLEGSVRTSGNKVRITAQLIRTADSRPVPGPPREAHRVRGACGHDHRRNRVATFVLHDDIRHTFLIQAARFLRHSRAQAGTSRRSRRRHGRAGDRRARSSAMTARRPHPTRPSARR